VGWFRGHLKELETGWGSVPSEKIPYQLSSCIFHCWLNFFLCGLDASAIIASNYFEQITNMNMLSYSTLERFMHRRDSVRCDYITDIINYVVTTLSDYSQWVSRLPAMHSFTHSAAVAYLKREVGGGIGRYPPPPSVMGTFLPLLCKQRKNFGQLVISKIVKTVATRCRDFKAKRRQIRFRLGLRLRPRWRSLLGSPRPPSCWI